MCKAQICMRDRSGVYKRRKIVGPLKRVWKRRRRYRSYCSIGGRFEISWLNLSNRLGLDFSMSSRHCEMIPEARGMGGDETPAPIIKKNRFVRRLSVACPRDGT